MFEELIVLLQPVAEYRDEVIKYYSAPSVKTKPLRKQPQWFRTVKTKDNRVIVIACQKGEVVVNQESNKKFLLNMYQRNTIQLRNK